jgi:hypothetical protein
MHCRAVGCSRRRTALGGTAAAECAGTPRRTVAVSEGCFRVRCGQIVEDAQRPAEAGWAFGLGLERLAMVRIRQTMCNAQRATCNV